MNLDPKPTKSNFLHSFHKRKKRYAEPEMAAIELNIMPFIDIFSLLCTFLIFSAVFVTIGFHEVQIPFFTNATITPPPEKPKDPDLDVSLEINTSNLTLKVATVGANIAAESFPFSFDPQGMKDLHTKLIDLKMHNTTVDKVTFFVEDTLPYDQLNQVLDTVKLRQDKDPKLPYAQTEKDQLDTTTLIPKVVLGSVIL